MNNPRFPNRQSIRLKDYNYSNAGYYHVTICSNNRKNIFGVIKKHQVELSSCGQIIKNEWINLSSTYDNIELNEFIIMPNHIHGIIILKDKSSYTLGDIICRYKSITTRKYNKMNCTKGNVIWQINYYEQITRNKQQLDRIKQYIIQNPLNLKLDF